MTHSYIVSFEVQHSKTSTMKNVPAKTKCSLEVKVGLVQKCVRNDPLYRTTDLSMGMFFVIKIYVRNKYTLV